MFKPKLPQQEQGFSLVEVLVAIVIATMFVAIAMQMMALAAVFKARAQEFAEATTWIQEDLEDVKYLASQYNDVTNSKCSELNPNRGYADSFRDDELVNRDRSGKYSERPTKQTSLRTKKEFYMTRTTTPFSIAPDTVPYNVLEVSYDVSPTSGGSPVAQFSTEVIPYAALQCPTP